jgi:hypothetical protein
MTNPTPIDIRVLEPIVNALAYRANAMHASDDMVPPYRLMHDIIEHMVQGIRSDSDASDPTRPWRVINFKRSSASTCTH